jgi:histidinol dehydrogenase
MMEIYTHPSEALTKRLNAVLVRELSVFAEARASVEEILEAVKYRGDDALVEYTRRFDAPDFTRDRLRVSEEEIRAAKENTDASVMRAIHRAAEQIQDYHRRFMPATRLYPARPGVLLGRLVNPVARAGIYVPGGKGGKTPLVSTVLMGAIPAKTAGVNRVVMTTPTSAGGGINPHLLAAAKAAGVDEIYRAGSAWAVGALAYGTETIPRVDVIAGPGNLYVTLAKRIVSEVVGTDITAGPSEILIIADDAANPAFIAADLLSQAEHDPMSAPILITTGAGVAEAAAAEIRRRLPALPRREIAEAALAKNGLIIVVEGLDAAFELAEQIAPEHLELMIASPLAKLSRVKNAGAVFLGAYTPEAVGDYTAGPNHVLPTAGTARFASALSVDNFLKKTSVVSYSKAALLDESEAVVRLAETEGLAAHAEAVRVRGKDESDNPGK